MKCEIRCKRKYPAYDPGLPHKLAQYYSIADLNFQVAEFLRAISAWRGATALGSRVLFVSDPWIAAEFRGGSLLLRNLFGMLLMHGIPIEWWTVEVIDDVNGRAYHQVCYEIFKGLKGESASEKSSLTAKADAALSSYEDANCELAALLAREASICEEDFVVLLDVNAMGLAPALRALRPAPRMIAEELRIGVASTNPIYRRTMRLLDELGITAALDLILHLHPSFIRDNNKDDCIGGFFCFSDARVQPLEHGFAQHETVKLVKRCVPVRNGAEFWSNLADGRTFLCAGRGRQRLSSNGTAKLFYLAARIDAAKNQALAIRSFTQALRNFPLEMADAHLILLSPTPSIWNNSCETEAIDAVLREIFDAYRDAGEMQDRIHIFFLPESDPEIGPANERLNRALQNLSFCHICISSAEGLSNAVFEAMLLKKVCLVHKSAGMMEQVVENVSGFTTTLHVNEIAHCMACICTHPQLPAIGQNAYDLLVSRFSPLQYAARFIRLLSLSADTHANWSGQNDEQSCIAC